MNPKHQKIHSLISRHPMRWGSLLCLVLVTVAGGMDGSGCNIGGTPTAFTIDAVPSGCGVKLSSTRTLNWVIRFTAQGVDPSAAVQWFFSDGSSATGQSVVHRFDTRTTESGNTGDHVPVEVDVTAVVGGDTVVQTFEIPMRGNPDGGPDPDGDTCIVDEGRSHIEEGTEICYDANPPASGAHGNAADFSPMQPGFYDEALLPEQWIHNLEHGGIVLLYDCGGECTDDLKSQLQGLFDAIPESPRFNEKKIVITRYSGVNAGCTSTPTFPASGPYLAIGWDVQRAFDSLDVDGIIDFYNRHVDQGPEDAPIPEGEHGG